MLIAIAIVYAVIAALLFAVLAFNIGAAYVFGGDSELAYLLFTLALIASALWPLTLLLFVGGWVYRKIAGID